MKTHFDELLDFPTVLNFKVMGLACDELPDLIIAEIQKHTPGDYVPKLKPS
jgi:putative lipoic acid-binding regulatory protein